MSTPLIVLAVILAFFALVLIPLMMTKGSKQQKNAPSNHVAQGKKYQKKKKG